MSFIITRGISTQEFSRDILTEKSGKQMVSMTEFAKRYQLTVTEWDGIYVLSQNGEWTENRLEVFSRFMNLSR